MQARDYLITQQKPRMSDIERWIEEKRAILQLVFCLKKHKPAKNSESPGGIAMLRSDINTLTALQS
jgi:hypothetical protein